MCIRDSDKIQKRSYVDSMGAFYFFINVSKTGMDGNEFAEKLLEKKGVALVPGQAFGEGYGDFVRLSYGKMCIRDSYYDAGMEKIGT